MSFVDVKDGSVTKEPGCMKVRVIMNKYSCSDPLLLPNKRYRSRGSMIIRGSDRKRRIQILPVGHKASTGHIDSNRDAINSKYLLSFEF